MAGALSSESLELAILGPVCLFVIIVVGFAAYFLASSDRTDNELATEFMETITRLSSAEHFVVGWVGEGSRAIHYAKQEVGTDGTAALKATAVNVSLLRAVLQRLRNEGQPFTIDSATDFTVTLTKP